MKTIRCAFSRFMTGVSLTIITGAMFCLIAGNAFAEETITIVSGEYAPWTGEKLKHSGFVNHVISEAFKNEGIIATYKFYPWKRGYMETKQGNFRATSYYWKSPKHEKDFYCSDTVNVEKLVFFHKKSFQMKDWDTLDDLKDYRIGACRGYTYTKEFWEAVESKRLTVDVADNDEQNFKMMLKDRINLFPCGLVSGLSILRNLLAPELYQLITYHPKPLSETTGHLLFPRKNGADSERLLLIFNKGLAQLKADGRYGRFTEDLLAGKYKP